MEKGWIEYPICEARWTYLKLAGWGSAKYYFQSLQIAIYNLILRKIFELLIKQVRFSSLHAETEMNVFGVLVVYYLNYGILYLICPSANYHQTIAG